MNDQSQPAEMAVMVGDQMYSQENYAQMKQEELDRLHLLFSGMRDKWVQHRANSGVEARWRRNTELYFGDAEHQGAFAQTLRDGPGKPAAAGASRSRVVVNIVRPKVDQAIARMCEILFPVDDRNWGLKPTPIPEIKGMAGNQAQTVDPMTGQPTGMTADDEAKAVMEAAKKAAEGMQASIDDSLTECGYNGESRKLIENGVRLSCGIMYGPFPSRRTKKYWTPMPDGTQKMQINDDLVPASISLDPWNVFFDPSCGNDHQRGRGFFIKRDVTRKELRKLDGLPGYDSEAIREVLRSEPKRIRVAEGRVVRQPILEDSYELWQYHGEIEPDEMEALSERTGDPLQDVTFGVLVMVNDKVIGAMESWVTDGTLPVDVWTWRKADDNPYGHGLPGELEHQQRVVNSAWRQVMDNGRTSLGGQIVMKKGMIIPEDKSYEITPNKVWLAKDDTVDVRQAFAVFEFQSHLEELLAIANAAMQFADSESNMPQLMGGEQGSAPETVGGTIMLFNNANGVLRQRVKLYDDNVTRPHIGRYFDWKMENEPDPNIKGDCEIDARGSTALIERDLQSQGLINLANITNNPRYIPHLNERAELTAILKAFKINPVELLKPEDQVEQDQAALAEQGAPPDPRIQAAEIAARTKELELQDRDKQRQFEGERNEREFQLKSQTLDYNSRREDQESAIAATDAQLTRELAIARMNQDGVTTQEERESKERLELIKIEDGRERFNAEMSVKAQMGSGI